MKTSSPATIRATLSALVLCLAAISARAQEGFTINEGLTGSWFNPDQPGQGFLIDVVPATEFMFVAWFTYEVAAGKGVGAPEHRWLTAQGTYAGASADLTLHLTQGGVFDDPAPVTTDPVGSLGIEFLSCTEAIARFELPDEDLSGEIPLQRLTQDVFCTDLSVPPSKVVTITYLGNEGVVVDDGEAGIAIDALGTYSSPWIAVPPAVLSQLQNATPPFAHVGVAAVTHNHGDHFSPAAVNAFLATDAARRSIFTTQGRGAIVPAAQTEQINPARFQATPVDYGGFRVIVVHTRHFNQFGNDFSNVDNYAYVVEIAGTRVLHLGDIDYATDNFQAIAAVLDGPVDALIIPTFNTLISAANRDLVQQFFAPGVVIGAHFRSTSLALESQQFLGLFPDGVVFDAPLEQVVIP